MILILTGPARSHKTTALFHWAKDRNDCGGILTPDERGVRMLYNVKERKNIPFQKHEKNSPDDVSIGRYIFDAEGFSQASTWLDDHLSDPNLHYVLLDEIGPLELEGHGWDKWIRASVPKLGDKTLILVVRRKLLDEVIRRYRLEEVSIVEKDYFLPAGSESPLEDLVDDDRE